MWCIFLKYKYTDFRNYHKFSFNSKPVATLLCETTADTKSSFCNQTCIPQQVHRHFTQTFHTIRDISHKQTFQTIFMCNVSHCVKCLYQLISNNLVGKQKLVSNLTVKTFQTIFMFNVSYCVKCLCEMSVNPVQCTALNWRFLLFDGHRFCTITYHNQETMQMTLHIQAFAQAQDIYKICACGMSQKIPILKHLHNHITQSQHIIINKIDV